MPGHRSQSSHRPQCGHGRSWEGRWSGPPPPPFIRHAPGWHRKRRFFLRRFLAGLLFFGLLASCGLATLTLVVTQLFGGDRQDLMLVGLGAIGLIVLVPILLVGGMVRAYRRYATPLADVMAAADAVADGDLSVRVPETGAGEFGQLARSFNRMTQELDRSDRQRRNMTADVAHELRTPLHIIQGNLEGILDRIYEPTDEQIGATLDEAKALARLVEDLQTISLAESGQLPLVYESVDMGELLADVETSFGPSAEADGIQLVLESRLLDLSGERFNLTVEGDPDRLYQVMTNLVANALRHTSAGGRVLLNAEADGENVRTIVRDTGSGIPAEDLPKIFDRFWRGDRSRTRGDGSGGGLGLAIVRQLVEAHGGQVDVASVEGEGSIFTVSLPRYKSTEAIPVDKIDTS